LPLPPRACPPWSAQGPGRGAGARAGALRCEVAAKADGDVGGATVDVWARAAPPRQRRRRGGGGPGTHSGGVSGGPPCPEGQADARTGSRRPCPWSARGPPAAASAVAPRRRGRGVRAAHAGARSSDAARRWAGGGGGTQCSLMRTSASPGTTCPLRSATLRRTPRVSGCPRAAARRGGAHRKPLSARHRGRRGGRLGGLGPTRSR